MNDMPMWKVAALLLAAWLIFGGPKGCNGIPGLTTKATAATYVYEKDSGGVPPAVGSALGKLNERGIIATTFEDDTTNASQQVPTQYKNVLPAARDAGLPALVVSAGERVVRTLSKPTTEEQVLEAVP
ncbi:MAG TPA: hypothetical protein VFV87_14320 [Pirellulaceae bacterium]|nr:hypothetical protein [Pirellulaceae bacterium]